MFILKKIYKIDTTKSDFLRAIKDQTETHRSFKLSKNTSLGGKDILSNFNGTKFELFPNTFLTDILGNMQFRIRCEINDYGEVLELTAILFPPLLLIAAINLFLIAFAVIIDFEWYARLGFFIIIFLFWLDYRQCILALNKLEIIIRKAPNLSYERDAQKAARPSS